MKTLLIASLIATSALAVAQSRTPMPINLSRVTVAQADWCVSLGPDGQPVGEKVAIPRNQFEVNAPLWQMSFDSMGTNLGSFASFTNVYGAIGTPFAFNGRAAYMMANDMNIVPATYGLTAKRIRTAVRWQPTAGPTPLAIRISTGLGTEVTGSGDGPAVREKMSGIMFVVNNQAASSQLIVDANLGAIAGGVPLPRGSQGVVLMEIGTVDSGGNFEQITDFNFDAQFIRSNMASPGEAYFPGTNPSSSGEYVWEDDTSSSPSVVFPNYFFEDYTNTTANGLNPYSEQYSGNMGGASFGGVYQPSVGLFVDQNARRISGTITFADFVPATKPKRATFEFRNPATDALIDTVTVALTASGGYTINDPNPNSGGTYKLRYRSQTWLSNSLNITTTSGSITQNVTLPINGDVNSDNVIDLTDYTYIALGFNKRSVDPDWNTPDEAGISPSISDLNGDLVIDLTDYTIVATNFNQLGN